MYKRCEIETRPIRLVGFSFSYGLMISMYKKRHNLDYKINQTPHNN